MKKSPNVVIRGTRNARVASFVTAAKMAKAYSDIERATLQFIINTHPVSHGYLVEIQRKFRKEYENETIAQEVLEELRERELDVTIELINSKLHHLGFEIAHTRSQTSAEIFYNYINTHNDLVSHSATGFTKPEIEIIKGMIESIMVDSEETFHVSSTQVMSLGRREGKTASHSEQFMRQLVSAGWFDMNRGHLTLGIRSLTELKRQLIDMYGIKGKDSPDGLVLMCYGCKSILTKGQRSSNCVENCWVRFHNNCRDDYIRSRRNDQDAASCPECGNLWETAHVGKVMKT